MAFSRLSLIKLLELILTLTCLGLHYNNFNEASSNQHNMLISGTFVGFSVILVGIFAGYLLNTPINKRLDIFYSLAGCAMFIASGALIIQYWNDSLTGKIHGAFGNEAKNLGYTKGGLAIVNGVIFLVDVVFTFRD